MTLNIDDDLLAEASVSTGIKEKAKLVRVALRGLIEAEAYKRLATLGGKMPALEIAPRRRALPRRK